MSYFATIAGVDLSEQLPRGRLVPLSECQYYVQGLASFIELEDGVPAYLWDDDETGTSDVIICGTESAIQSGTGAHHTDLGRALVLCAEVGATMRVWWAGRPNAQEDLERLEKVEDVLALVAAQARSESVGFVFKPSGKKTPPHGTLESDP